MKQAGRVHVINLADNERMSGVLVKLTIRRRDIRGGGLFDSVPFSVHDQGTGRISPREVEPFCPREIDM